jgi:uncharacterized membrane protein HdeD (DUF308 family)
MTRRDNWLLALPPALRLLPPLLLALLGGASLVWLHRFAPQGWGANLSPLVWFGVGVGLLVRPAQALVVSATALGMAALAAEGAQEVARALDWELWHPEHTLRITLWGGICLLALPAAVCEALAVRPVLARRCYFTAIALFFLEQGARRLLGVSGRPTEAISFFLVAGVAVFAVFVATRTLPLPAEEPAPAALTEEPAPRRRVRYLDETPHA